MQVAWDPKYGGVNACTRTHTCRASWRSSLEGNHDKLVAAIRSTVNTSRVTKPDTFRPSTQVADN